MSRTQAQMIRLVAIGQATESGVREQFDRHLEELRGKYEVAKGSGEQEHAAFVLALSVFVTEVQDDV